MAYTKQTWVDNETPINAERMNHIENGIRENSIRSILLVKEYYGDNFVIDNQFDDIREAIENGFPVYVIYDKDQFSAGEYQCEGTQSGLVTFVGTTQIDSGTGYIIVVNWPTISEDEDSHNEVYLCGGQYDNLTLVQTF